MDVEWSEYEHREERDDRDDKKKSSRGEDKDHRSKERERSRRSGDDKEREKEAKDPEKERGSGRERKKDDRNEREKDRSRDNKVRDKDHDREKNREKERERDKDRKERVKEKDREKERDVEKDSDRGRDKERGKEKNKDRDKEKEKERDRDRAKEKEREREREKHRDREKGRDKDTEKEKEKNKEKEREADQDKEKSRDRTSRKSPEGDYGWSKDGVKDVKTKLSYENRDRDVKQGKVSQYSDGELTDGIAREAHSSTLELEERILKMKEERSKKNTEDVSEIAAWVNRSRKLEEKKHTEKEKAMQLSKVFEEQDKIVQEESEDEEPAQYHDLAGVKVLHGLDKVMEGGAVVLTLKDQNILADGDINEDVDMLENVEIGEQKRRDDAYKAAKKKVGIYDDKFNDDPYSEKKMLPQYDDPATDEGLTLDQRGRITVEAEKKLEELRRRLQGASTENRFEDLNLPGKISSDYFTPEEMVQFKKPKKKKSLRKKEKLDIDALEAEAVSAGLGVGDLGSRNDSKRQTIREEEDRAEAERRNNAYQAAYAKADEASKSLRLEQTLPVKSEEEEPVFADEDEDLYKALERARKLALKKKQEEEVPSGPQAIALLAATTASSQNADEQTPTTGESQENKVVFTEMEEFVWGLQYEEEAQKPDGEDVFMQEDEEPKEVNEEVKDEPGGWTEVNDTSADERPSKEDNEEIVPDEIIHEVAVGKGLSGALKLLKDRGTLKESIDWGGRNMDKKKSKLVGIIGDDEQKEIQPARHKKDETRTSSLGHSKETHAPKVYQEKDIHIERTDEFGRILTPKEAFRILSHKFHGKGPGKMKQEKRMKQFQEELKLKQMKSSDTPSLSVERMRDAQAQLKTPYLVLSGHVKPGQTSDPRSGFATVEKDLPGGLTPMLGDRKVEHFLGIKRKPESTDSGSSKKPKS